MKKILLSAALLAAISVTCFADEPKAVFRADDANITASQMIYEYAPESLYHVDTQVGYITDIMLKPGEVVGRFCAQTNGTYGGQQSGGD